MQMLMAGKWVGYKPRAMLIELYSWMRKSMKNFGMKNIVSVLELVY